jgi:hypothetical protein
MRKQTLTLAAAALILLAAGLAGPVVAQNNTTASDEAPLYENTSEPNTDSWLDGVNPDLPGLMTMVGRLGTFVIGGGGGGVNGSLLTGVLVMGLGVGTVARAGVGDIAGVTLAVAGVFAGVATGIAPQWTSGVLMFGVGLVLASVFRRILN